MHHHKYILSEFDDMIPWERTIYISMLSVYLQEQEEKLKQKKARKK